MQLDDFQKAWSAHGALLERSLAIDERLLRELCLRKVRFALAPYVVARALEIALGVAALLVGMPVLAAHVGEARYLVVGGAVAVFALGLIAQCAYLLVHTLRLDFGRPVTALRREVERLQLVEYRSFEWALLGGVLLWLPILLVLFEGLTGVEAIARVHLPFLAGNLAVGAVVLALGHALSRRYVERADLGPRGRRLVEALSGRGLRRASAHLAELARFEREDGPAG
jgi:hypothetical protein